MKVFTYQCGRKFSDSDIPCLICFLSSTTETEKGGLRKVRGVGNDLYTND